MGILGVILGLIGLAIALLATMLFGIIGGGIAIVLAALAIVLGIFARKKRKGGLSAIVIGVIAAVLAVYMTIATINTFKSLRDKAQEHKDIAPHIASYCEKPEYGIMGIIWSLPQDADEATADMISKEIEALNNLYNDTSTVSPAASESAISTEAVDEPDADAPTVTTETTEEVQ